MYKNFKLITALIGLLTVTEAASAYSLLGSFGSSQLTVNEMNIEHYQYETHRDPYFADAEILPDWRHLTKFNINLGLTKYIFWDNNLHLSFDQATTQVRHVGWEYTIGLHVTDWLDVMKYHHSQHVLEDKFESRFPNTDAYGIRIKFITSKGSTR